MKLAKRSRMSTDARREQLLAAGAELLGRRPYDEVSIEEIGLLMGGIHGTAAETHIAPGAAHAVPA